MVLGDFGSKLSGNHDTNTVFFAGKTSGYLVAFQGEALNLVSKQTGLTQEFHSIERISVDDGALATDINGLSGQAYRLYQAAFDRKPDLSGLGYWINAMDKGISLTEVAGGFITSDEFRKLYGAAPSNTDFLSALYKNVLHRSPDCDGYAWWLARLNEGVSRKEVLASFSESPENQAQVIGQIEHGIDYLIWP